MAPETPKPGLSLAEPKHTSTRIGQVSQSAENLPQPPTPQYAGASAQSRAIAERYVDPTTSTARGPKEILDVV